MKSLPEREIQIGRRLRAFREAKRISRTAFALSIRIGSERLATYEAGRVPLRFEVFKAISQEYSINPMWLATGEGSPSQSRPLPFDEIELLIPSSTRFSQAYDSHLDALCRNRYSNARVLFEQCLDSWRKMFAFLNQSPEKISTAELEWLYNLIRSRKSKVREVLNFRDAIERRLHKLRTLARGTKEKADIVLTEVTPARNMAGMTEIAFLLQRLKRALEGVRKGDLARSLKVPLPRVSEWLSGRVMPSGETTLRLLHWVEQQEQKPNALGSTTNTTKGTVTRRKLVYEKKPTSSHKPE
jgi:transcriptional regulator with XRE-family HTH domain